MRNFLVAMLALALFSCGKEEKKESLYPEGSTEENAEGTPALSASAKTGKEIFEGKGNCFTCHKAEQKAIGPGIIEIAKAYKAKNGDMVSFLKGKAEPIVDPAQYEVMKTNFYITKTLTDEELKGIEDYFYSYITQE